MSRSLFLYQRPIQKSDPEYAFVLTNPYDEDEIFTGGVRSCTPTCVRVRPARTLVQNIHEKHMSRRRLGKILDKLDTFVLDDRKEHVSVVSSFEVASALEAEFGGKQTAIMTDQGLEFKWDIYGAQAVFALSNLSFTRRFANVHRFMSRIEARRSDPKFRLAEFGNLSYEHFAPLRSNSLAPAFICRPGSAPPSRRPRADRAPPHAATAVAASTKTRSRASAAAATANTANASAKQRTAASKRRSPSRPGSTAAPAAGRSRTPPHARGTPQQLQHNGSHGSTATATTTAEAKQHHQQHSYQQQQQLQPRDPTTSNTTSHPSSSHQARPASAKRSPSRPQSAPRPSGKEPSPFRPPSSAKNTKPKRPTASTTHQSGGKDAPAVSAWSETASTSYPDTLTGASMQQHQASTSTSTSSQHRPSPSASTRHRPSTSTSTLTQQHPSASMEQQRPSAFTAPQKQPSATAALQKESSASTSSKKRGSSSTSTQEKRPSASSIPLAGDTKEGSVDCDDALKSLRQDFNAIDRDGSGYITVSEVKELLLQERHGLAPKDEEVRDMMMQFDCDDDGKVSFQEYCNVLGVGTSTTVENNETDLGPLEQLRQDFNAIDNDGSGFITVNEVRELMKKERNGVTPTEEEVEEMMAQFDVNEDGRVTFQEYCRVLGGNDEIPNKSDSDALDQLKRDFEAIDDDGSGFITVLEVRQIMIAERHGQIPTQEEVDEMMSQFDTDGDGKVSFEDYCRVLG